jgi:hypothetical protein
MEEILEEKEVKLNRIGLGWVFFRRGWGIFFTFVLVAITASGVAWDVVLPTVTKIPWLAWLNIIFPDYGTFCLVGGGIIVIFAILLGWKDFTSNKGSWRAETAINYRNNIEWVDMRADLKEVKKDNKEMRAMLEKLVEEKE